MTATTAIKIISTLCLCKTSRNPFCITCLAEAIRTSPVDRTIAQTSKTTRIAEYQECISVRHSQPRYETFPKQNRMRAPAAAHNGSHGFEMFIPLFVSTKQKKLRLGSTRLHQAGNRQNERQCQIESKYITIVPDCRSRNEQRSE